MHRLLPSLMLSLIFLKPFSGKAQSIPDMVTDRPDVTESALTVPNGLHQVEFGANLTKNADLYTLTPFRGLYRYGINDWLEFRGELAYYQTETDYFEERSWFRTVESQLGAKCALYHGEAGITDIGVIASVPILAEDLSSPDIVIYYPGITLTVQHDLLSYYSIGYNLGFRDVDLNKAYEMSYSLSNAFSVNEKVGIFAEGFGTLPTQFAQAATFMVDGGCTWKIAYNLQLDISAGMSLTDEKSWFAQTGLSFRLPQ